MTPTFLDTLLVGLDVDRDVRDAIVGDLIEERAALAAIHGKRSADRWLRQQIVRSVAFFVRAAVCDRGIRILATIVGAALAALIVVILSIRASAALWFTLISPDMLGPLTIVAFAIDLAYGAAGGYLAARLARAAPLGAALVFGILGASITIAVGWTQQGWDRLGLPLLLIPATMTGGWLRARHLARHDRAV